MKDETEVLDLTTDEALISALTPKQLGEIELKPFSLLRQAIATDLCSGGGSSNFHNIVMTVWICTLNPRECLEARDDVMASRMRAFEWAEARGYSIMNFTPLIDAYKKLNDELTASTNVRLKGGNDGDAPKNDGGQLVP
jgi:hypothetical protein